MTQSLKPAAVCASIALLLALIVPVAAQRKGETVSAPLSPAPYRVGERLTYNVSFSNFISAAHVELRVVSRGDFFGRQGIQLRAHIETSGVVNAALYALNNDYVSYVDPVTGLPYRTQQSIREAARTLDNASDLNQPGSLDTGESQRTGGIPGTYDFISVLYRLRALPLTEGSSYKVLVRGENRDYQVEVRVTGRETLKTNVGSFNALLSQVKVRNDSEANDYNIRIYFSDDERHMPVLITAKHRAGEIRAELAGSEFLTPAQPKPPVSASQVTPATTTQPTQANSDLGSLPFKVGEQLNYQVFLANNPEVAGTASFQVRGRSRYFEHDGLMLSLQAQTTNSIQRLFFANDKVTSYIDPKTLLPFRTELNLIEGRRRLTQIFTINQDYGSAVTQTGEKIEIPVGTHDFLSFFYALRTFNLIPPKRNAISLLVNNEPKTLFISSLKRETIQLGGQQIPAIQVSLTTDDPQSDKFLFRAWISDDARRIPLRLTASTEIGEVRADLAIIPLGSN